MPINIRVVNPATGGNLGHDIVPPLPDFVRVEVDWPRHGLDFIESRTDHALCVPYVLERVAAAAREGMDGVMINCFMDPGLGPARELVHIPVAGPGESSMLVAASLGRCFSVVTPSATAGPIVYEQAISYGVSHRLVSVRSVEVPVADMGDHQKLAGVLVDQAKLAIEKDGAHVLVLGCTGMSLTAQVVRESLRQCGFDVPLIDPQSAAIGMLVALSIMGTHHSGVAYALPSRRREDGVRSARSTSISSDRP